MNVAGNRKWKKQPQQERIGALVYSDDRVSNVDRHRAQYKLRGSIREVVRVLVHQ